MKTLVQSQIIWNDLPNSKNLIKKCLSRLNLSKNYVNITNTYLFSDDNLSGKTKFSAVHLNILWQFALNITINWVKLESLFRTRPSKFQNYLKLIYILLKTKNTIKIIYFLLSWHCLLLWNNRIQHLIIFLTTALHLCAL